MSIISNIKNTFALTAVLFLFTACGGGGGGGTVSTTTEALKVIEVQSSESIVTENEVIIEWIENDYTTELIEYGTSTQYGSELLVKEEGTTTYKKSNSELVADNVATLSDLEAGTTYNYRIVGKDRDGKKVVSSNKTFKTSEPIVTEPAPEEPIVTEPTPTEPIVTEPAPEEPIVTEPAPEEPIVTDPAPTEPIVTEPTPEEPIVTEPAPTTVCKTGPAQQLGQIKDSTSGSGLVDVTVTISGCSTKTDTNGYYTLSNISITDKAVVTFEKEGYQLGSTNIQIKEFSGDHAISTNYLEYNMFAYGEEWSNGRLWTYDSQNGANGGAVEIPAGTIHTDAVGNVYNGIVSSRWTFKDTMTAEGRDAFPGAFEGVNTNGVLVPFVSFGLMSVELKDEDGDSLILSNNITLVLSSVTGTTANTIPLWYYDYNQGLWIEEGYAERQSDGTYRGEISHTGTWSLNQQIEEEVGIYRGHIVDEDGLPMSDVRLYAIGDNWISSDLSTDENGLFEIEVIPGSNFQLVAYNYKDKYEAKYNGIISAIASGEIVED